ncbi:MAG: efflux RND transporter periplasmic adaptor subunit [Acidobacteriaceae bacterium]|nr:efflux RND transporter periplasmic adaptor subunit [Acidobacteriaceae bacterium]
MARAASRVRGLLLLLLVVAAVAAVVLAGIRPRLRARQTLQQQTNYSAAPTVTVVRPKQQAPAQEVVLPGNIQAFIDAPIYARTNGYLKRWYFDIGAHVKEGQLLADVETPEIDQQLEQARHDLASAQANAKLAEITATRYMDLLKSDSVAKQDVDTAVQNAAAKEAELKSAEANVRRLEQLVSFEKIYAPFDGVITARNTDIGQLIESGSSGGPARELFHVAATNKLRVFINVPQIYSHEAVPGVEADLTLPEMPGRRFVGRVVRTAGAFDPNTRTLPVEVDVVNTTGLLFPGAYTEIHLKIRSSTPALVVPATSLMFRAEGLRAATVINNRAKLLAITPGRDFGNEVEVVAGLTPDTEVIVSPPDSLIDGEPVRVVPHRETKGPEE